MSSVQDIETRLQQVERKLNFIMTRFQMGIPNGSLINPQVVVKSMLDLYRENESGVVVAGETIDVPPGVDVDGE